ncbi:hypothetical protein [Klebsiella variicola]|uniref:hypothetical protein n=1 Tax=Klebsiella variicola TaxID=244366 RepID=UPI003EBD3673
MNIETVNELIASLESAGELSIKETKVIALAKAFKQLAAENVALSKDAQRYRFIRERDMFGSDNESGLLSWEELAELECNEFDDALDARINHPNTGFIELDAKMQARKTPATDRIVAGIKADGVEDEPFGFVSRSGDLVVIELNGDQHVRDGMPVFVKDLREGAK